MATELKAELAIDAKLIAGSGGIFEVIADGQMIFQKKKSGHFPDDGEVTSALRT